TLLHRDMLITIDRATGAHAVMLDGVRQPHAVRTLDDRLITFSDTKAGEGVIARITDDGVDVLQRVGAETDWLHDAYFDGERWLLVDGANSRVVHADADGWIVQIDYFDPEWCLYEVLPWQEHGEGSVPKWS